MTGTETPPIRSVTIYLLKSRVGTAVDAIEAPDDLQTFSLQLGREEATLFVKPSNLGQPSWTKLFKGHVDFPRGLLQSASSAAVLLLSVADRWFAITFGYGRHLLTQGVYEPNFGLRVTLNSIADASIRSIDRKSFDTIARHTREEASRAGSIEQFGLNVEEDLLRAVVGTPEDAALGRRMAGMDALTVTFAATLAQLPAQLERYLQQWGKQTYRNRYPWVDHVNEVRDRRQVQSLDAQIVERLGARELDHVWLAVPVPIDWSQVGGFRFSPSTRAEIYDDIHAEAFLKSLRDPTKMSAKTLRRKSVYCLHSDGRYERDKWSIYQCLYAEIRDEDEIFLLTGGRWYRVARQFVRKIDEDITRLPPTAYELPPYSHESEAKYNAVVAEADEEIALMDNEKIWYGGGASQIEFCDLFIQKKTLLHVKRYGASSVLSHLFSQGVVSATLFVQDQQFRTEVRRKLGPEHREGVPEDRPDVDRYEIGFAVVSRSAGDLVLPFFSKVNLRNAARTLMGLGYRVTLTKIDVQR